MDVVTGLRRVTREAWLVLALFVVALAVRVPSLRLPLLEWHGWRQTWTAYTAVLFHDRGIDLFHPQLPIFGPPFEVPMEFPLVQAVAAVVMNVGVDADLAMRLVHLALFVLSAALLYGLMRRVVGVVGAIAAVAFFLFVPENLLWSRASLVEYGATAGALGFLWAGLAWREQRHWSLFGVAFAAGTIGMLVKPTTPIFWSAPLILWAMPGDRDLRSWFRARLDPALVALCVVPVAIAYAWTMYADGLKGAQEAAAFMTSTATRTFYYASLDERIDGAIWERTWSWISGYLVGVGMLPVLGIGLWIALRSGRRLFWCGMLLAALLPFAIFYGGYYKHDYYWAALTPEVAAFVGVGTAWLVARATTAPRRAVIGVALIAAASLSLASSREYWSRMYPPLDDFESVLPRAHELAAETAPNDLVVVVGRAYDPDLAYYARRQTLMLTVENETDHLLRTMSSSGYSTLFSWSPAVDQISVARYWAWNGVLAPHTYAVGASARDMRGATILATDDTAMYDQRAKTARNLLAAPLHVPCDLVSHAIPVGAEGTWLRFEPDFGGRVWATPLLAPLAVRSVVILAPSVVPDGTNGALYCEGASELVIDGAFAAPPPTQ